MLNIDHKYLPKNNLIQQIPYLIDVGTSHIKLPRYMHTHDDRIEILFIRDGIGNHKINNKTYTIETGDILIFDANTLHEEIFNKNTKLDILYCSIGELQLNGYPPNKLLLNNQSPVIKNSIYTNEIVEIIQMIHKIQMTPTSTNSELLAHLLCTLILLLYQSLLHNTQLLPDEAFNIGINIKNFIDKHYLEDINIQTIANTLQLSESYITKTFKKTTHQSIIQYIIRRRIGEAQSWLLMSNLSITEIALKVGYNSISNFQNTFKKIVNMSPKQYRIYWKNK